MRLLVTTPTAIVVDAPDVRSVRAEDESGSFGILDRHADFETALVDCVVVWRDAAGEHYCAVRHGVLSVSEGKVVAIATREAVRGDDLARLEADVVAAFQERREAERSARTDSLKLQMKAIRQIVANLGDGRDNPFGGEP